MVGKYTKNKYCHQGERQYMQALAARRDLEIGQKKEEAYQNLFKTATPFMGVYRNLRGDFLKIVEAGNGFGREDVPAYEQVLNCGHLWMPCCPTGLSGTMFDEEREYGNDEFRYVLVLPMEIGFNFVGMLGEAKMWQRKPIRIITIPTDSGDFSIWDPVSTNQYDPSRSCVSVLLDGYTQEHPAGSLLPPRPSSSDSALGLVATPPQQLDTAGEAPPSFRPDHDGMAFLSGSNIAASSLGGGINSSIGEGVGGLDDMDFSFDPDVNCPVLDDGVNLSSGNDNSAVALLDGFQQLIDYNKSNDTPAQPDICPYPGYAPAKRWRST
ncbi:hypothetical protein G6011_09207 [Alternaria panax]|uniref:Uncharacterized protein n=1 Tax=Alternaria panax TaxID=48097 RepID=A0AAD4IAL6_9PLEO|nr:hypothetical protein G6011_09207 [Alternaria panax]